MSILSKSELRYHSSNMVKARTDYYEHVTKSTPRSSVFLSHKHSDKVEVQHAYDLLNSLGVSVYIDWLDPNMPETTRGETAIKIKDRINSNDKFILLATENAIASKWCNWELGYGDAYKHSKNKIALFPIREDNSSWRGNEYMEIYPYIEYESGDNSYQSSRRISEGYYVKYLTEDGRTLTPLKEWLESRGGCQFFCVNSLFYIFKSAPCHQNV